MEANVTLCRMIVLLALLVFILTGCGASGGTAAVATNPPPTAQNAGTAAGTAKLNLNEASEEQLLGTIPNLGDKMAEEFEEYSPYVSIQQFRKEMGKYVSAEEIAAYEKYVYVPIDINQSDAETLLQLQGVDTAAAEKLIAGRPYTDNSAFLAKLGELTSTASAEAAKMYLAVK